MGKGNNNKRIEKKNKKEERKKQALGLVPVSNKNSLRHQNVKVPQLKSNKQKILDDLKKKQKTSARTALIESLQKKLDNDNNNNTTYSNVYQMAQDTTANNNLYDITQDNFITSNQHEQLESKQLNEVNRDNSRKAYMRILDQVIENSDVVLEILDSRDPLSCRSKELESKILNNKTPKKVIGILNKIDLIPVDNALLWQNYLQREYPTVLFKSNTQNQNSNGSQSTLFEKSIKEKKDYLTTVLQSNKAVGGEELLNILKNYCRQDDIKTKIVVGVIGYPNVGKSSLINSLKRGKVVGVSSTPGYTKGLQEIILDGDIKGLDCPGVVFGKNDDNVGHNVIRTEDIKEPIEVVVQILKKMSVEYLIKGYDLNVKVLNGEDITSEKGGYLIGDKMKKYKKGGLIDGDKSARLVINDWNDGKLKYFSVPPTVDKDAYIKGGRKEEESHMAVD